MKRFLKIIAIIAIIAGSSLLLALAGILIGSGAVSAFLGLNAPVNTGEESTAALIDEAALQGTGEEETSAFEIGEAETETETPLSFPEEDTTPEGVIMVGDSRTIGMQKAMAGQPDPFIYIGQSGEGYSWLTEYALKEMDIEIKAHPSWPVVLNLGVNDTDLVMDYITLYQSFAGRYPDTSFFYLSVNPLTKESVSVTDDEVVIFNRYLKTAFPESYLDSYSVLKKEGFESVDGVHYSDDTYRRIHKFILDELEERF